MYISPEQRALPPQFDYGSFALPENVALSFRLDAHVAANDLPPRTELRRNIRDADAIVIESVDIADDLIAPLGRVALGDSAMCKFLMEEAGQFASFRRALYAGIYKSKTPVTTIDVKSNHPSVITFKATSDVESMVLQAATSEKQALEAKWITLEKFDAIKVRDQSILQNLRPRIDQLTARNPKLAAMRERGPASVSVYYGSLHRSLLDAVLTQQNTTPTPGFSAATQPDSKLDQFDEAPYALHLRGLEIPDDLYLRYAAKRCVTKALNPKIYQDMSTNDVEAMVLRLINGKAYPEVLSLVDSSRVAKASSN